MGAACFSTVVYCLLSTVTMSLSDDVDSLC
ncbi:hypothetical protein EG68_11897 [Paragonimus skrjabini miyazakii]|uniref:Uncharacterized protein n=1 Tax=Paragonimus skrjabini miyazakii TaxID=59628 RepID=A0A8S9YEI4_9TREM|nr:hypothetical protein EG68_11897 [Paragonimus skrjabini miyazakii]